MIQIGAVSATLDAPVEHLTACHRRIEQRLDALTAAAMHLEKDPGNALEAISKSMRFLDSNGAMHTADEEDSLFPRLRPKLSPEELAYVDSLEADHQHAEAVYVELKDLVAQAVAGLPITVEFVRQYGDCAARLRTLYRDHIQSEDEVLTGLARRSLTESELAGISAEMRERRDKVI